MVVFQGSPSGFVPIVGGRLPGLHINARDEIAGMDERVCKTCATEGYS